MTSDLNDLVDLMNKGLARGESIRNHLSARFTYSFKVDLPFDKSAFWAMREKLGNVAIEYDITTRIYKANPNAQWDYYADTMYFKSVDDAVFAKLLIL